MLNDLRNPAIRDLKKQPIILDLKEQLDMYKAMANSGCYQITIACESGVQRVLDELIHKRKEELSRKASKEK